MVPTTVMRCHAVGVSLSVVSKRLTKGGRRVLSPVSALIWGQTTTTCNLVTVVVVLNAGGGPSLVICRASKVKVTPVILSGVPVSVSPSERNGQRVSPSANLITPERRTNRQPQEALVVRNSGSTPCTPKDLSASCSHGRS